MKAVRAMHLAADRRRCIGSGQCALLVPAVFEQQDSDGRVRIHADHVPDASSDDLHAAVQMCPVQALRLEA
ncbi:ferredoxin [Streptomyces sp. NPDC059785]|uniref:ferredoxin n=1 Tax=unclassified Streptomyces TaxID=2593676 RepID=UPI00364EF4AC